MNIVSIDIGKLNFAYYIENLEIEQLKKISHTRENRYEEDGTPTKDFKPVLNKIYKIGTCESMKRIDLTRGRKSITTSQACDEITKIFNKLEPIFLRTYQVIIEQQFKWNIPALKIGQHCYSYFRILYPEIKVVYFSASQKYKKNGCPNAIRKVKRKRKKWATPKAKEIMKEKDTELGPFLIEKYSDKSDDVCDCIIQAQAWKVTQIKTLK